MQKTPPASIHYRDSIILRPFSPKDGPAIYQAVQDSMDSLKRFMFWAHFPMTLGEAYVLYAEFYAKTLSGEEPTFAAFDTQTGECLFCASLCPGTRLNPASLDVGYWVSAKHQRLGLGTLATQIMSVLAFNYYEADRLSVMCNPENIASLRVIEKCGFHKEGKLRNGLPAPTEKMIADGYSPVRTVEIFSLIPEDLEKLSWFKTLEGELSIRC